MLVPYLICGLITVIITLQWDELKKAANVLAEIAFALLGLTFWGALGLGLVYGAIRFVHWAWVN